MSWNLDEAISYYIKQGAPRDQSALIGLLREIQQESGGSIPSHLLEDAAGALNIKSAMLHALVKRIPSLRISNQHCLEVCCGPNCGKAKALADFAEDLCRRHKDSVALRFVPCMRMCGKGPNIRWDGTVHHQATPELLKELIK